MLVVTADDIVNYFTTKIQDISLNSNCGVYQQTYSTHNSKLDLFETVIKMEDFGISIMRSSEKANNLNPAPTWLIKKFDKALVPFLPQYATSPSGQELALTH